MRLICLVPLALVLLLYCLVPCRIKSTVDHLIDHSISHIKPDSAYHSQYSIPSAYNVSNLCSALAGKYVLFIGPETTAYLHTLWLDALEAHENRSISCDGRSCSFHHVCRPGASSSKGSKFPHRDQLLATNSSLIRYVRSNTLHASKDPRDRAYTEPIVDSFTGVRVHNAYWLRHARQADLVVLNHGPLPAPVSTYVVGKKPGGNWTFPSQPVYVAGSAVVNAALHATLTAFIPAAVGALDALEGLKLKQRQVIVWHSSWLMDRWCSDRKIWSLKDELNGRRKSDAWTLYYNAQGM
ncbi:hypothetical protein H0H92_007688 [Tricholoma furcatifolium]|nr:hypothetical protein H0H92_007688 [Tricholoma furcatifolium]